MSAKLKITFFLCLALPIAANDLPELEAMAALTANLESLAELEGPFSPNLFEPSIQLARLQLDSNRYEEAIDNLQRAQNIIHREDGVYSAKQLQVIALLANIAIKQEEYENANTQKRFAFFVSTKAFQENSPEILDAYSELADWYINTGQSRRGRNLINDAIKIAESTSQDPLPFDILDNHARRLEGSCCNPKRLIRALAERSHGKKSDNVALAYLEVADTFILGGKAKRAADYYKLAHEILPINSSAKPIAFRRTLEGPIARQPRSYQVISQMPLSTRERLRRMTRQEQLTADYQEPQWFLFDPEARHRGFETRDLGDAYNTGTKRTYAMVGHPILFSEGQLDRLLPLRWKKNKEELYTSMSFTVTETGDLKNIEIVESNAPTRLNRILSQALHKTYYRPALKSGKPIASQNVTLRQSFLPREPAEQ